MILDTCVIDSPDDASLLGQKVEHEDEADVAVQPLSKAQAHQKLDELKAQRDAGQVSDIEYRARKHALRVACGIIARREKEAERKEVEENLERGRQLGMAASIIQNIQLNAQLVDNLGVDADQGQARITN